MNGLFFLAPLLLGASGLAPVYYLLRWLALAAASFVAPFYIFRIPLVYLVVQHRVPAGRMERKHVLK